MRIESDIAGWAHRDSWFMLVITMGTQGNYCDELQRTEINGAPVLLVRAERPAWAPTPTPPKSSTLRWMLAEALRPFLIAGPTPA